MTLGLKWIGLLATAAILALLLFNIVREPARQQEALSEYRTMAIASGMDLYAANCAHCHGAAGEGLGVYRALNQQFIVSKDARDLHTTIQYGRYATDMAAFGLEQGGALTPTQIDDLVTLLQHGDWALIQARVAALGMMPTEADIQAAEEAARPVAVESQAVSPEVLARARTLFAEHCVKCHGEQGQGTADAPQLNNAYVRGMSSAQLTEIVGGGVRNTKMEGFAGRLPDEDRAALVVLLQNWDSGGESVIATEAEIAAVTETGQQLFETWCAICHGARGEGGAVAPSLNDIPHLPADFMATRIRNGQNAMPPFSEADLSNGQMAVVITYAQASIIGSGLPDYSPEELTQGQALYTQHCAECHGSSGEGVPDKGPRINTMPPMRAVEIVNFTRVGSALTPAIPSAEVSDQELRLIVAYIHSLSG